ncbi:MAG: YraN family protein [Clostridia bacterium]|nr:YraN family protein [Clostridia bacterium]
MTDGKNTVRTHNRSANKTIGRYGEDAACAYLEQNGYRIVGRNVYADGCEADILAENETHFVFAEVKTRREHPEAPDRFGRPANAVTAVKRTHMLTMARAWLREHPEILEKHSPRLDVIEVYLSPADPPFPGSTDTSPCPIPVLAVYHFPDAVREKPNYARTRKKY